ncbi:MAG: hypothetical protein V2A74_02655 [bacterium]
MRKRIYQFDEGRRLLGPMRILAWMLLVGVAVGLGIGKVALEAKRNSLLIETRKLQDQRLKLQEELISLQGEAEALKDTERLASHARNRLGLVPIDLSKAEKHEVPEKLIADITSYRPEADLSDPRPVRDRRPALLARLVDYLEQAAGAKEVEEPASPKQQGREIARADSLLPQ